MTAALSDVDARQPQEDPAVAAARAAVASLAGLDWSSVGGREAVDLLVALRSVQAQLDAVRVKASGVVRDSGVWGLDGSRSAKAFLERTTGASGAKVASDLKLAERLTSLLPLTETAFLAGELSAEHAQVLARGACGSPARREALGSAGGGEAFLLSLAGLRVDEFKTAVARWAYRVDPDADDAKRLAAEDAFHFDLATTMDGVHVRGFLTPEVGEGLMSAMDAVIGNPTNDGRTQGRRRHDALATLTQLSLASGGLGVSDSVRPQLVVHVDWDSLVATAGAAGVDPAMLQESRSPIPRSVLDRIACDSQVTRIVFGPRGQVLDVGRAQRTFTGPRRRALDARDGGCRIPGCNAPPRLCEGHHLVPWWLGGLTNVEEGYLACWAHHDWIHARDIRVTRTPDGGLRFEGPDGHWYGTTYPRVFRLAD